MKPQRPTLRDVATRAGVSSMTVSRALAGSTLVSQRTRRLVEAAARDAGYIPNLAASALSSRRSGIIGALVSTLASSLFTETIHGLERELRRSGYHLLLGETGYSTEEEARLLRAMLGRQPDGLILSSELHTREARRLLKTSDVPVVEIWDLPKSPIRAAVGFSNRDGGRDAGQHFLACGYTRMAYAAGRDARSEGKWQGFRQAIEEAGGAPPLRIELAPHQQLDFAHGAGALDRILAAGPDLEAVFLGDDVTAACVLFACARRGIAVPDRLALCGFGDLPIAQAVHPRLTTVRIPFGEIARTAASMLTRLADGEALQETVVELKPRLIVRKTTHRAG